MKYVLTIVISALPGFHSQPLYFSMPDAQRCEIAGRYMQNQILLEMIRAGNMVAEVTHSCQPAK